MKTKVGLREIEEALRNPRAFVRGQRTGGYPRYSRFMALRSTALDFHKDNDLSTAQRVLEERFRRSFKVIKGNDEYFDMLKKYVKSFLALGTTFVRARINVSIQLPEEYGDEFQVSGQITRLDIHPDGGYRAWLFSRTPEEWQAELKYPLIQEACAKQLNVGPQEIVPGVYEFSGGTYTQCQYTKHQIRAANGRLLRLLDEIKRVRPSPKAKS